MDLRLRGRLYHGPYGLTMPQNALVCGEEVRQYNDPTSSRSYENWPE